MLNFIHCLWHSLTWQEHAKLFEKVVTICIFLRKCLDRVQHYNQKVISRWKQNIASGTLL